MEVKQGYKQTDIGVIPSDWEVRTIGDIADVDADNLGSSTNPEYEFMYISLEDVGCGVLKNTSEIKFKNAPSRARRKVKKGDVLISTVRPNLKSHLFVSDEVSNWICSTGYSVLRCKTSICSRFIFDHFFSSIINLQIDNLITGSNYPSINGKDVKSLQIPVPPTLAEQTAIATALSDADSYIASLEKLIAKKRLIKQGTIQHLFKPKEDWVVNKIHNIIIQVIDNRGKTPPITNNPSIELIETNAISFTLKFPEYSKVTKYVTGLVYNNWFRGHPHKNDILVSTVGEYSGATAIMGDNRGTIAQNLIALRINEKNVDSHFVFYWSRSTFYQEQINQVMMNQAQPSLRVPWLLNFTISFPLLKSEQTRIAAILSDMDKEMECLEKQLSKAKSIKHGMMQQLLTGKIRLV
jgi:type I restriction enzyme S subunit